MSSLSRKSLGKILLSASSICIILCIVSFSHVSIKGAISTDPNASLQSGWLTYVPNNGAASDGCIFFDEWQKIELDILLHNSKCWRTRWPSGVQKINGGYYQLSLNYGSEYSYIVVRENGLVMIALWTNGSDTASNYALWMSHNNISPIIEFLSQVWMENEM